MGKKGKRPLFLRDYDFGDYDASVMGKKGKRPLFLRDGQKREASPFLDDVTALMEWGIVERDGDGLVQVPYSVIHAAFDLKAVA